MRPAALIPALLFALASASNITNNTTSNATNTRYCKCENVDDTNSVADYKLMCETEASSADVVAVTATFRWADQGWGYKKGQFEICRADESDVAADCWSSPEHLARPRKMAKVEATVASTAPLVANFSAGDRFRVRYVVGGGGGHELYIKRFVLAIERPGAACDEPRARGAKSYCQCTPPKLGGKDTFWRAPFRALVYGVSLVCFCVFARWAGLCHRERRLALLRDNCVARRVALLRARRAARVALNAERAALYNGSTDLRVHTLAGETELVRVEPADTVERVTRRIAVQVDGAPPAELLRLVLVHDGVRRPLDGERPVSEYPVLDGAIGGDRGEVHMVAVAAIGDGVEVAVAATPDGVETL